MGVGCDILLFFDRKLDRVAPWRGGVWEKDPFVNIFCVRLCFVMCPVPGGDMILKWLWRLI